MISIKEKYLKFLTVPNKRLQSRLLYEIFSHRMIDAMLNSDVKGVTDTMYCNHKVIVSLTSYGKRLQDVAITIESIMQGSMKPNRLVLWVDEQWKNKRKPIALQLQQERGLEIEYCRDIRSYTKLVPALRKYPEDIIITIDDDVLYRYDLIERLVNLHLDKPDYIIANRIHRIILGKDKKPISYLDWECNANPSDASPLNFLTGVGGVLYPPHCLDEEVFNEDVFLDICKYADDIWFNAMALKKGTKILKGHSYNPKGVDYYFTNQEETLHKINVSGESLNDIQMQSVFEKYNLYEKLYK